MILLPLLLDPLRPNASAANASRKSRSPQSEFNPDKRRHLFKNPSFSTELDDWIESVERGALLPSSPARLSSRPRAQFCPPLTYWLNLISMPSELPVSLSLLPRARAMGLRVDHAPDPQDGRLYPVFFSHPISFVALERQSPWSFPLWFLKGLLDQGANPNAVDALGVPLFFFCGMTNDAHRASESWRMLVERGANPHFKLDRSAYHAAREAQFSFEASSGVRSMPKMKSPIEAAFEALSSDHLTPLDFARFRSQPNSLADSSLPGFFDSALALDTRLVLEAHTPAAAIGAKHRL